MLQVFSSSQYQPHITYITVGKEAQCESCDIQLRLPGILLSLGTSVQLTCFIFYPF